MGVSPPVGQPRVVTGRLTPCRSCAVRNCAFSNNVVSNRAPPGRAGTSATALGSVNKNVQFLPVCSIVQNKKILSSCNPKNPSSDNHFARPQDWRVADKSLRMRFHRKFGSNTFHSHPECLACLSGTLASLFGCHVLGCLINLPLNCSFQFYTIATKSRLRVYDVMFHCKSPYIGQGLRF